MTDNDRIREELGFNLGSSEYNLVDRQFTVTHRVPQSDAEKVVTGQKVVTILGNDDDGPAPTVVRSVVDDRSE